MKTLICAVLLSMVIASSAFAVVKVNDSAPAFSLRDRTGKDYSLDDVLAEMRKQNGHGMVLGFFASWCVPCRNELPRINSVVDDLRGKGVAVVLVGVKENFHLIDGMLGDLKVDKPVVLSDEDGKTAEKYGVRFLPVTFFIGVDGKVKDVIYGEIANEQELTERIQKLLKK